MAFTKLTQEAAPCMLKKPYSRRPYSIPSDYDSRPLPYTIATVSIRRVAAQAFRDLPSDTSKCRPCTYFLLIIFYHPCSLPTCFRVARTKIV